MSFEQFTFLGASVRNFNTSLGWGTSPSTLSVSLVEDDVNGDLFTRTMPGTPVFFIAEDFQFGGILQGWTEKKDTSGNPTYDVQVQDPRELLDGVQLILDTYTGGIYNVPNLYNIYGYLESVTFGYSGKNESGIEWWKIKAAFLALQSARNISLGSYSYTVDLSRLPVLPNYYRVGANGAGLTLMEFITDLCDAASRDFFFRLTSDGVITLYTVDRSTQPALGYINSFIQGQSELVSGHSGYEFRNDTTSKFLAGGSLQELYFQWKAFGDSNVLDDNTIWPYYGLDYDGNVLLGSGSYASNEHNVVLDSIRVDVVGIGDTYPIDIREMRSALHSQESWELTLMGFDNDPNSIHYQKATRMGMFADKSIDFVSGLTVAKLGVLTPASFLSLTRRSVRDTTGSILSINEQNIGRLYEYVSSYASEYYGRKFIIGISGIASKRDEFTNEIFTNWEPTDGGYIDEVNFSGAINHNLLPTALDFITLEDGRIAAYAKFDNYTDLDFADLSPEEYRVSNGSLFVRGTIEPQKIQFLDISGVTGARAVFEISSPIYSKVERSGITSYNQAFVEAMSDKLRKTGMSDTAIAGYVNSMFCRLGGEFLFNGQMGLAKLPDMVAVPLKSNVNTYGPWYSIGANGKTEFEADPDLVPWNYGGYATMNLAASSRVSSALTSMQIGEGGSLTIAGLPTTLLGDALISSGPLVTDITCDVSEGGITTTYRMSTWTPRFGKTQKQFVDRMQKMSLQAGKNRRIIYNQSINGRKGDARFKERRDHHKTWPKRKTASSSAQFIAGEYISEGSGTGKLNVVMAPPYNINTHIGSGYESKAIATFDTLFCPFTTDPSSVSLPHFRTESPINTVGASALSPFGKNNFNLVSREHLAENELVDPSGYYKGVGLRAPLILGGWGFDTNGRPVPNSGTNTNSFLPGYAERPLDWKVGPLDIRWNNDIQCWQAGTANIMRGTLLENLTYTNDSVPFSGYSDGTIVNVSNWLLTQNYIAYSGKRGFAIQLDGDWHLFAVQPAC